MPSINESLIAGSQMQAALDAGIDAISDDQDVVFTLYRKFVFSQDGSVFWVATSTTISVRGSLHYASDRMQNEDETVSQNMVLLSAEQEVTEFNAVAPGTMWVGAWPIPPSYATTTAKAGIDMETGSPITIEGGLPLEADLAPIVLQVVFGRRGNYFAPADVWHYSGFAVYPALSSQLVQSADDLPDGPIVSNSLPIWMAISTMAPVYPSFLVDDNLAPPYIAVHIDPSGTETLQAAPALTWPGTIIPDSGSAPLHNLGLTQLNRDEVEITLYGFNAQQAAIYLQSLIDASLANYFGFANSPAVQDAKRTQVEIAALAQKKTLRVVANYYLNVASGVARRLLLTAMVSKIITPGGIAPEGQGASVQDEQLVNALGTVAVPPQGQGASTQDVQLVAAIGTVEGG